MEVDWLKTGTGSVLFAIGVWQGIKKLWTGGFKLKIMHPLDGAEYEVNGKVELQGTYEGKRKGECWLLTRSGEGYYPQKHLDLKSIPGKGHWSGTAHVGGRPGPRQSIILVMQVSDHAHSAIKSHQAMCDERRKYTPIGLDKFKGSELEILDEISVSVKNK